MSFPGSLLGYVNHATNGRWVYENKRVTLNQRDTVYFQIVVVDNNSDLHSSDELKFSVLDNGTPVLSKYNVSKD